MRLPLHDGWTVRAVGGDVPAALETVLRGTGVPATVPGSVHTDLLAAGLIPDPYLDENEELVAWVGRVDWRYETTFAHHPAPTGEDGPCAELVAEGLDTVATVELNGQVVGETANQHRTHRLDVAEVLVEGENSLTVTFAAGEQAVWAASEAIGPRPCLGTRPFNALRTIACKYGWDWGPVLVTAGIWQPLTLHTWGTARLAAVRPLVDVDGSTGLLHAHVNVRRASGDDRLLTISAEIAGRREEVPLPPGAGGVVIEVAAPDVKLWWPRGHGAQALYPVAVTLTEAGRELDHWQGRVGFRTVTLDTTPDADGTPFRLVVNGAAVFTRGLNWIPDDCFPTRVTRERYAERLGQAVDVGANLLRVWGGGRYESDDFYDLCDELGILTWQDFLFACATYPEEEPLRSEVEAEAREVVARLSPHPSLVLWNGNNENIWGFWDWGWRSELDGATWGWGYYTGLLPQVVAELDPTRPYCPGSPYSMAPDRYPNDPRHGLTHEWEVWNRLDYTAYRERAPRFAAEFGWQGPPAWATLTRAVHDDPLTPESRGVRNHQKAEDGLGKLTRGLAPHLPEPGTFDDWHWAMSLNQARAVQLGVEHFRSWTPLCSGAILWQLNDCWPVTSWAVVDGDGRRKPAWYALRRAFADRLVTVQPRDGGLALVLVNDSAAEWVGTATLQRLAFDGTPLVDVEVPYAVEPRGAVTLPLDAPLTRPADPAREVLLAQAGGVRGWWWFTEDRNAALPAPELDAQVEAVPRGYRLTITAHTLVKDLAVLADRVADDAEVDDMLLTLLPGETAHVLVTTTAPGVGEDLLDPLVLRSVNQLLVPEQLAVAAAPAR